MSQENNALAAENNIATLTEREPNIFVLAFKPNACLGGRDAVNMINQLILEAFPNNGRDFTRSKTLIIDCGNMTSLNSLVSSNISHTGRLFKTRNNHLAVANMPENVQGDARITELYYMSNYHPDKTVDQVIAMSKTRVLS